MDGEIQPVPWGRSFFCLLQWVAATTACFSAGKKSDNPTSSYHPSSSMLGSAPPWLYLGAPNSIPSHSFDYFPYICSSQMLSPLSSSVSLISFLPCSSIQGWQSLPHWHAAGHLALAVLLLGVLFNLVIEKIKKGCVQSGQEVENTLLANFLFFYWNLGCGVLEFRKFEDVKAQLSYYGQVF